MDCPRGHGPTSRVVHRAPYDRIELDVCQKCGGVWFDRGELAAALQLDNLDAFSPESPLLEGQRPSLPCPRNPKVRMFARTIAVPTDPSAGKLELDQCAECGGVWLDGGELPQTVATLRDKNVRPFLEDHENAKMGSIPLWLFMFFTGLPIEQWNPSARRPIVMPFLVATCIATFVWQISGGETTLLATTMRYGLVPERLFHGDYLPLFTSMFLHGSWAHLLGNLYFLWVFGDNVEDRLGSLRFLALYLVAGIAASLAHAFFTSYPAVPELGASGAVSGVMAAYAVLFPRTRLISLIFFFRVRWRASVYLLCWLGLQILGAYMHRSGIAWWAHIGGFVVGGVFAWRFRPTPLVAPSAISPTRAAIS
jgi:membrane associated rhomboid family serine protease/Zn-finger nucleic acid-binding protein